MMRSPKRANTSRKSKRSLQRDEYRGLLAEPVSEPSLLSRDEEWEKYYKTLNTKMRVLMEHFGIDPGDPGAWVKLSCELARGHVPGFMGPRRKQGRPADRNEDDFTLWMLFELLRRRDGKSARAASKSIAQTDAVKGAAETLRTRHKNWMRKNKPVIEFFERVVQRLGEQKFVATLEATVGGLLRKNEWG
jgi:hypothetical protein